ncbi:MAG: exosortase H-associated membrane protein [Parahaliea sp.]
MNTASPYRFMGWVLLLMVPLFALWYAGGNLPAAPAFLIAKYSLLWGLPEIIDSIQLQDTRLLVLTHFGELNGEIVSAEKAEFQLAYPVDTRLVSYSIPFFAALMFASGVSQPVERFCRGLVLLWLVMGFGLVSIELKNLMLGLQQQLFERATLPLPPPALIALLYQLNTLMVPTLLPVLLWLWLARDAAVLRQLGARNRAPAPPAGKDDPARS